MSKHKSEDYKISAVNYYLDNDVIFLIVRNNATTFSNYKI